MVNGAALAIGAGVAAVSGGYLALVRPNHIKITRVTPPGGGPGIEVLMFKVEYFNHKRGLEKYISDDTESTLDPHGWIAKAFIDENINERQRVKAISQLRQWY